MKEPTVERCPTLEELLQAADCELSPEAHAAVLQHLQECAVCHARDRHTLRTMRDIHGYLAGAFGEERQQARRQDFAVGLHKLKQAQIHRSVRWPLRRWLPMAALVPVFIVAFLLSRTGTVVLQADELLRRAVAAERTRPQGEVAQVRVRLMPPGALTIPPRATAAFTITQELTDGRVLVDPHITTARATGAAPGPEARMSLAAQCLRAAERLARHHFEWRQPLDAGRFNAWRDGLPHRRDLVIALPDVSRLVLRTTTTDDQELVEAELTVERDNYHVVRAAYVFEGVGRLEIDELERYVRRPTPATILSAERGEPVRLDRDTLVRAELATRLMLAQTGLDLPGTMRVSLTPEQVRVEGAWPSAAERRALNGRLLALPHVIADLHVAEAGDLEESRTARSARARASDSELARFLARTFVDEHARDAFMPELMQLTTAVRQRLAVMQGLAERFAEPEIRDFSPDARATWQQLLEWHYQRLRADLNGLDTRVRVLSGSESRVVLPVALPADWPRRIAAGLTQAVAFDHLVQELFAQQGSRSSEDDGGRESLTRTFRALWDSVVNTTQAHGTHAES